MPMSSNDKDPFEVAKQLLLFAYEAKFGIAAAFIAVHSLLRSIHFSSALNKIRHTPSVDVSGLRSGGIVGEEVVVVVRGTVEKLEGGGIKSVVEDFSKSVVDKIVCEEEWMNSLLNEWVKSDVEKWIKSCSKVGWIKRGVERGWIDLLSDGLLSSSDGDKGVILEKTRSCIYGGIYSGKGWREESSYTRSVPFVLKQGDQQSKSDYLVVNLGESKHPFPLVTVHRHIQAISAPPCNFLQGLFRRDPVGVLYQEKILPPGKEITAVGVCCSKDGVPEINPSKNLPYFLTEMSKDEMIASLKGDMKVWMWISIVAGSVSISILGYAIARNWKRWKKWQQQAREVAEEAREVEVLSVEKEEARECVVCFVRGRESAFLPCGHLICCTSCVDKVARKRNSKCPVCRQSIRSSVRIYSS